MKRLIPLLLFCFLLVPTVGAQTAQEILRGHIEAVGGEEAWRAVQDQHAQLSVSIELPQGVIVMDVDVQSIYPGYVLARQNAVSVPEGFPDISSAAYLTPEGGWMDGPQGRQEFDAANVPASAGAGMASRMNPLTELDLLAAMDTLAIEVLPQEEIKGKPTYVLQIEGPATSKRFYDVETGLLVASEIQGPMGMSMVHVSEYQDYDGLKVAMIQEGTMSAGGQSMTQTIALTGFEVNTGLTPEKLAEMATAEDE